MNTSEAVMSPESTIENGVLAPVRDAVGTPLLAREDARMTCRNVNVYYGEKHAIHDVSLDIGKNEVIAMIGPSGCGKSTFLRCLNRMNDTIDICRVQGQIRIDDQQPIQLQYSICFPTSCQVQMELTDDLFQKMRTGKQMVVAAMNIQQKTMGFPVPLTGFTKAYDGPPVDNAVYEQQRRQLMEMFRKRQQELAAKAKQGQGTAQQGAPAQPAPQQ